MVVLSFIRAPADFNLWEEEETQPLHLLQGNLIMDSRFRRSGVVWFIAIRLSNATRTFAPDLDSVLFPVWSNRLWPCIPMSYNIPFCPITASPRNHLDQNRGFYGAKINPKARY